MQVMAGSIRKLQKRDHSQEEVPLKRKDEENIKDYNYMLYYSVMTKCPLYCQCSSEAFLPWWFTIDLLRAFGEATVCSGCTLAFSVCIAGLPVGA